MTDATKATLGLDREEVARIIDPETWANEDNYPTVPRAGLARGDYARFRESCGISLAKADAILALAARSEGSVPEGVRVDAFLAEELCKDQHGPSYWGRLTPLGREMYVERYRSAVIRADQARAAAGAPSNAG